MPRGDAIAALITRVAELRSRCRAEGYESGFEAELYEAMRAPATHRVAGVVAGELEELRVLASAAEGWAVDGEFVSDGIWVPRFTRWQQEQALENYMSDLSEDCYFAGWLSGLEYELWDAVLNGPREYGHGEITAANIARLRELADVIDAWIADGDVVVPMAEWQERYRLWKRGE